MRSPKQCPEGLKAWCWPIEREKNILITRKNINLDLVRSGRACPVNFGVRSGHSCVLSPVEPYLIGVDVVRGLGLQLGPDGVVPSKPGRLFKTRSSHLRTGLNQFSSCKMYKNLCGALFFK